MVRINKVYKDDILEIYTDGASRNNPGKGAGSYVFVVNDQIIKQDSFYFGDITNNQAEYKSLINALDKAIEYTRWNVKVFSDSELIVKQMSGEWRVKDQIIKILYREASEKEKGIKNIEYFHVPRTNKFIKIADKLCNACLNKHLGN